jgi:predicted O-methyltransferase YrrM
MSDSRKEHLQIEAQWLVARLSYGLTNYRHPLRVPALRAIHRARRRAFMSTTPLECVELYGAVAAAEKVDGDMAEAGVYLGGTALVMLAASPSKRIHLFDTFEGLPHEEGHFMAGGWAGSVEDVQRNLAGHADRIEIHQGLFPASAVGLEELRFSFVHLDLDLYDSTKDALEWFWPRLMSGGILLSHDYPLSDGVVRAFDEFFAERPEPFVPLSGNQALAVKP